MPKIACWGWRGASAEKLALCEEIGAFIVRNGFVLATGNAPGPDQAFARGANRVDPSRVHLYLPWPDFHVARQHPENKLICHFTETEPAPAHVQTPREVDYLRWAEISMACHPAPARCDDVSRQLLIRNAGIVEGANQGICVLNPQDSHRGGSNHTARIAEKLGVLVIDVSTSDGEARIRSKLAG